MLPQKYKAKESEPRWQKFWLDNKIFSFDPDSKSEVYSIDTPPPTVSGVLHIGHVYSYTQAEIVARYQRMKGKNVFYPFGFDDNGLPTERFVEKQNKVRGKDLKRSDFNQLCKSTVAELEKQFQNMWTSLGFSADWNLGYSTIEENCQRISQRSFLDLLRKDLVDYREEPNMWCVTCQTAIAQAELDNVEHDSSFNDLRFELEGGGSIVIGTTRPELLPSCVCIFVHPDDPRYVDLQGKTAIVPIFGQKVPVIADEKADMEKGTGAVMCCTFGDKTDIEWFKKHGLPLRVSITPYGKMTQLAGEFEGLKIKDARKAVLLKLKEDGILINSKAIAHPVNVHERCGTDIEFLSTQQWFVKLMQKKQELVELADKIDWYPTFMKQRYVHWVENLNWDWCISRQRFFGVPFPVWHCKNCNEILVPSDDQLPVDPQEEQFHESCPKCGSQEIEPDTNIMDTWATSSVTPQVNFKWGEQNSLEHQLAPMSMRPQAHDIIRTWAFYTMVKAYYHHDDIPWKDIMISGHVLYKKGQKISKSKGNSKSEPEQLIEQYSADVIRYWTAGAKLGSDCYFEENEFKIAAKLVTKVFNASKFALLHLDNMHAFDSSKITMTIDKAMMSRLNRTAQRADQHLAQYEYSLALAEIETFFWDFCDNYMELIKHRVYNPEEHGEGAGESVKNTLYAIVYSVIRLLAPFIPHITEEIYQAYFREREGHLSLHLCEYPQGKTESQDEQAERVYEQACHFVSAVRKYKTEQRLSLNTELTEIQFLNTQFDLFNEAQSDIKRAARCDNVKAMEDLEEIGSLVEFEGKQLRIGQPVEVDA